MLFTRASASESKVIRSDELGGKRELARTWSVCWPSSKVRTSIVSVATASYTILGGPDQAEAILLFMLLGRSLSDYPAHVSGSGG